MIPNIEPYIANKYRVNPVIEAPKYLCVLVYNVKAIMPGDIAANNTQNKKLELKFVSKK